MEIPNTEPTSLRAGDTWAWTRTLSDYPASAWTLTYYFRNATAKFDIAASADGDSYSVTVAKASSGKIPGWYDWIAFVESATERHQVGAGRTQVLANLAADTVHDGRTFARRMLDAIESALESRATGDQLDMIGAATGDRNISRDKDRLMMMRTQFKLEVRAEEDKERRKNGGAGRNKILMVG
jgi:hypothetical protein